MISLGTVVGSTIGASLELGEFEPGERAEVPVLYTPPLDEPGSVGVSVGVVAEASVEGGGVVLVARGVGEGMSVLNVDPSG